MGSRQTLRYRLYKVYGISMVTDSQSIKINLSRLKHTWLIDLDGTLLKHNAHKKNNDELLSGVIEFWEAIPSTDIIILLSARAEEERVPTLNFLATQSLRYDHTIFGLPTGERILINDEKPSGLTTAVSINIKRDIGLSNLSVNIDNTL
jgi:hypothetical protein